MKLKQRDILISSTYLLKNKLLHGLVSILKWIIIIGISYIIMGPVFKIISNSFTSVSDAYNPLVYMIPMHPTMDNIRMAFGKMDYYNTLYYTFTFVIFIMLLQTFICSLVGYGFARFKFYGRNILFAGVILTIVIPVHTIMVPLYTQFRYFDVLGIFRLFTEGQGISIINTKAPMILMTLGGVGLRSGLFIYIFRQFYRALPKEIEEAALIDGAGVLRTYFTIMLPNAKPSLITVLLFSLVWQYNDTFFSSLFMPNSSLISIKITTMAAALATIDNIYDPTHVNLIVNAGVLFTIIPLVVIYLFLQKYFIEGVERSGLVG